MKSAALFLLLLVSSLAFAQTPVDVVKVEPHSHTRCALASLGTNDSDPWGSCLVIWYRNVSSKRITGIRFDDLPPVLGTKLFGRGKGEQVDAAA
jgi:hypothetical protein